jgi:hypothetical protein
MRHFAKVREDENATLCYVTNKGEFADDAVPAALE